MGRSKKERTYSIKPKYKSFIPQDYEIQGEISLNHDELEAVFLMDFQDMYQEDAAKLMQVSRPTLSRIIKSARNKIATALIQGANLKITDEKEDFVIAISLTKESDFSAITPKERLLAILKLENDSIKEITYIPNPIFQTDEKPSIVFPQTLKEYKVNFFITSTIGEGLKNSLIANGIFIKEVKSLRSFKEVISLFK